MIAPMIVTNSIIIEGLFQVEVSDFLIHSSENHKKVNVCFLFIYFFIIIYNMDIIRILQQHSIVSLPTLINEIIKIKEQ